MDTHVTIHPWLACIFSHIIMTASMQHRKHILQLQRVFLTLFYLVSAIFNGIFLFSIVCNYLIKPNRLPKFPEHVWDGLCAWEISQLKIAGWSTTFCDLVVWPMTCDHSPNVSCGLNIKDVYQSNCRTLFSVIWKDRQKKLSCRRESARRFVSL